MYDIAIQGNTIFSIINSKSQSKKLKEYLLNIEMVKQDTVNTAIRIPKDIYEKIEFEAESNNRTYPL